MNFRGWDGVWGKTWGRVCAAPLISSPTVEWRGGGRGRGWLLACLLGGFWGWMGLLLVCDCGTEKAVSILGLYSNALTSAWLGGRPPPTVPPISAGY